MSIPNVHPAVVPAGRTGNATRATVSAPLGSRERCPRDPIVLPVGCGLMPTPVRQEPLSSKRAPLGPRAPVPSGGPGARTTLNR
jgi:hypothetical protein